MKDDKMKYDDNWREWHLCRFDDSDWDDPDDGKVVAATIVACATLGMLLILLIAGVWME